MWFCFSQWAASVKVACGREAHGQSAQHKHSREKACISYLGDVWEKAGRAKRGKEKKRGREFTESAIN